jgi:hypothetical protein
MDLENDERYKHLADIYMDIKQIAFEDGSHDAMRNAAVCWLQLHRHMNPHDSLQKIILDIVTGDFKRQHQLFLKVKGSENE